MALWPESPKTCEIFIVTLTNTSFLFLNDVARPACFVPSVRTPVRLDCKMLLGETTPFHNPTVTVISERCDIKGNYFKTQFTLYIQDIVAATQY